MNLVSIVTKEQEDSYRQLVKEHGSPLLVLDCNVLRQRYRDLKSALPGVELFYAIKSLPEKTVISTLAGEGASFDVATTGELDLLSSLGVNSAATIHTHPIKRDQDIRDALTFGCKTFVVDNIDELYKFVPHRSRAEILLRVSFRSKNAKCDLSRKYGCDIKDVPFFLAESAKLGILVKGLSFHVGSQSLSSDAHVDAVKACMPFYQAPALLGTEGLSVLDIGGGFPVDYALQGFDLDEFCAPIRAALSEYPSSVRLIAEPGRVLSAPCMVSIATVVGKAERSGMPWYYLDDGVYGAYSGQIYDHAHYPLKVFGDEAETRQSVLAGPTCDSIDIVAENIELPLMNIGDLVVGEQMGAYTLATASEFNSIPKPTLVTLNVQPSGRDKVRYLFKENSDSR